MTQSSSSEDSQQWPQYLATMSSMLLGASTGLHFAWTSPAIPKLLKNDMEFQVSPEEVSYIVMIGPLGYVVGCPMTAILLDKIGRKFSILILAAPQIIAWLMIALARGVNMLYIARITTGISEGGALTAVPVYIGEISEPSIRGVLGMSYAVSTIVGSLLINCYGSYMPIRTSAFFSILVPLSFLLTFAWVPESPYYLLMKGQVDNARKSLKKLRSMKNVEQELDKLTLDVQRQISEPRGIKDVFLIKSNLRAFLIMIGLRTLQQFSGGAALILYNQVIFGKAAGSLSFAQSSIIFYTALVVMSCCGAFIVDCVGRKPLMIWSTAGAAVCLFIEGIYFTLQHYNHDMTWLKWLPITGMVLYTVTRGIGLVPVPTLLAGELFSASVKPKAMGLINIHFAICTSTSSKLFQWLSHNIAMHVPFFFFVGCCILGIIFMYKCVIETKGKTLEEIQQQLKELSREIEPT